MRIAIDVSYIHRQSTGLGRYSAELVNALISSPSPHEILLHGWSYSLDTGFLSGLRSDRVRLSVARIPGFAKRWYWNHLRFPPLEAITGDFDVFQSADPFLPPVRRGKTVATVHDLAYRKVPQHFGKKVLAWDSLVARSLERADAIIVPSLHTRADLADIFGIRGEKVCLVRPPVCPLFAPGRREPEDSLARQRYGLAPSFALFVGTLEPRKNLTKLLEAFGIYRGRSRSGLQLVIAGKRGWMDEDILRSMRESPYRADIRHLGFVSDNELSSLYRLADFLVYPSVYEGHGSPVVEAMASGTPVVTSSTSSLGEIAEGAALLVDPSSAEEIAGAISEMAGDPVRRKELSAAGIERAARFSARHAVEALAGLYNRLGGT